MRNPRVISRNGRDKMPEPKMMLDMDFLSDDEDEEDLVGMYSREVLGFEL